MFLLKPVQNIQRNVQLTLNHYIDRSGHFLLLYESIYDLAKVGRAEAEA